MVGLLDIAAAVKEVELRGHKVKVTGISARGFVVLLSRFPEIKKVMANRSIADVSPERLMELVPEAIEAIIAAGMGYPGNDDAEKFAGEMGIGEQVTVLTAIIDVTFPDGIGPFVEQLHQFASGMEQSADAVSGWAQGTKSPERSSS